MKWRAAGLAALVLLAGLLVAQHHFRTELTGAVETTIARLHEMGALGLAATAAFQFLVSASGIIPASLLGVAAGGAYGFVTGFLLSASGVVAGALAAFAISRSAFRPAIAARLHRTARWQNFDRAVAAGGWRFVCLVRLSPLMPFAIASYALGLSSIRLKDYLLGTLAALPALALYVFFGTIAHAGLQAAGGADSPWKLALLGIGAAATIGLCIYIGKLAAKSAGQKLEEATSGSR